MINGACRHSLNIYQYDSFTVAYNVRQNNSSLSKPNKTTPRKTVGNVNFPLWQRAEREHTTQELVKTLLSGMLVRMSTEYWSIVGEMFEIFNHTSNPDDRRISR